jgi:hypothetical protein
MLTKLLNPMGIRLTNASAAWIVLGTLLSLGLHVAFYGTLLHFVIKFW